MKLLMNKKFILVMMVAVLFIAGVVNRGYNKNENVTTKILGEAAYVNNNVVVEENDLQAQMKTAREKARDETKEMLQEIINNPNTTNDGRLKAEEELITLAKMIKNEVDCEAVLSKKGFENAVVTISDDSVNVSVNVKNLMNTEIAQITETVSSITGMGADKIKILSND